jgi:hypothetical protein
MMLRQLGRFATAMFVFAALAMSTANAAWTITTYRAAPPDPPQITSMAIADQYFTGALAQRFMAESTVTHVNLYETGGNGQFADTAATPQFAFPGLDKNENGTTDTADFTARITGTIRVAASTPAGTRYNFFTDSDDGNRFRLDINRNGTFEDATESIVPDGGLQGSGDTSNGLTNFANFAEASTGKRNADPLLPGYYPDGIELTPGDYPFEISFFERAGGGSIDAGFQRVGNSALFVLGQTSQGISLVGPATVKAVGGAVGAAYPGISSFAIADPLRTQPNAAGFPQSGIFETFNLVDSGGGGDFPNDSGVPGLGAPDASDDNDFLVVGTGVLVVPAGGITGAIFRSNTDDGGRLRIDVNQNGSLLDAADLIINDDVLAGPHNFDSQPVSLAAGQYAIEYSWFEAGGGAEGEVSVNLGQGFRLLNDRAAVAAGMSLAVIIPEPASFVLVGLALVGLAGIARRRV